MVERPPPPNLREIGLRLAQSLADFKDLLALYDTAGVGLVRRVIERLDRQRDPAADRFPELVKAADELRAHLKEFDELSIQLTSSAGYVGYAVTSRINSLQIDYLSHLAKIRPVFTENGNPAEAISQYLGNLKNESDTQSELGVELTTAIGFQAIEAFDSASDLLTLRMYRLLAYLQATDPPQEITGSQGRTYKIPAARDAIAREAAFTSVEEALKRIPTEFAGQLPILSIAVSIGRIATDVRSEIKAMDERRALWEKILNDPWKRGPDDATFDGLEDVRKDDRDLRELSRSLTEYATNLLALPLTRPSTPGTGA